MLELMNKEARVVVRDAAIVTLASVAVALAVNAVRAEGIPIVQKQAYDILVPCPEPVGDAQGMVSSDPRIRDIRSLVLDVRLENEFKQWHVEGAQNQPFDWLGPPVDAEVKTVAKQVAASRAQRVIVYGDGDDPDSGQEWAKLLSGARIKHVFFVKGGAPALNPALSKPESPDSPPVEGPPEPSPASPPSPSVPLVQDAAKGDAP